MIGDILLLLCCSSLAFAHIVIIVCMRSSQISQELDE